MKHETLLPTSMTEHAAALLSHLLAAPEDNNFSSSSSVYSRVRPLLHLSDEHLDPSPSLNASLTDLVNYLQATNLPYTPQGQHTSFATVEAEVCRAIDASDTLTTRANAIRSTATRAESRLELHFAPLLLRGESAADDALSHTKRVVHASSPFPYVDNYLTMVEKESEIIRKALPSIEGRESGKLANIPHVVFCGSGPLPLTGIFLITYMRCRVTLVDNDEQAVKLSTQLIRNWEKRGIIPTGRISVILADCADLTFLPPSHDPEQFSSQERSEGYQNGIHTNPSTSPAIISCDVLFVAALIPNDVKDVVVKSASLLKSHAPLVVVRSAHGLTARTAYFGTGRALFSKYMLHYGTVVPESHRLPNGTVHDDDQVPIAYFPSEILNSLELYLPHK